MKKSYVLKTTLKETEKNPRLYEMIETLKNTYVWLYSPEGHTLEVEKTENEKTKHICNILFNEKVFDNELFKKYAFAEVLEMTEYRTSENGKYIVSSVSLILNVK